MLFIYQYSWKFNYKAQKILNCYRHIGSNYIIGKILDYFDGVLVISTYLNDIYTVSKFLVSFEGIYRSQNKQST